MANYYGTARTNYFRVKDAELFLTGLGDLQGIDIQSTPNGLFCILGDDLDGYNWNVLEMDDETGEYESVDLPTAVAPHLMEDEVAVFIESGSEKLRYIFARAEAINSKGETVVVDLNDIYQQAAELSKHPEAITRAEY